MTPLFLIAGIAAVSVWFAAAVLAAVILGRAIHLRDQGGPR